MTREMLAIEGLEWPAKYGFLLFDPMLVARFQEFLELKKAAGWELLVGDKESGSFMTIWGWRIWVFRKADLQSAGLLK